MSYQEFLTELNRLADLGYKDFHGKLLHNPQINLLGVRVPKLREVAKKYKKQYTEILEYPDEYYEVTFIKFTIISQLSYEEMMQYLPGMLELLDNWATCDCFKIKITGHEDDYLSHIKNWLKSDKEFVQRFALVQLLNYYSKEIDFAIIEDSLNIVNQDLYYVSMASAWLLAELCVWRFDDTINYLKKNLLPIPTHNRVIQKAIESYRLTSEQKINLKKLKR